MKSLRPCLLALLLQLAPGFVVAADITVKVIALFADKALLQVGNEKKIVKKGEIFQGVLLQSASGRGAVVIIDGKPMQLNLNQSIAGNFKKPERNKLRIYPDSSGMYFVDGEINGQRTHFLVDTGATMVTLSGYKARQLKIDFRKGRPETLQTAASLVQAWVVKLDSVRVGGIKLRNVDAFVLAGQHPTEVLLGNSFLNQLQIQKAGSVLELKKRF